MKHVYTKTFSRRTKEDIKSIRRVTSIKKYEVDLNKMWVTYTDIEVMKFKREIKIKEFFETYKCSIRYSLIEYVIEHQDDEKLDRFFFALKKSLLNNNSKLLGYIRLVDLGNNGGIHHHIVVAIPKIQIKNKSFPEHLKRTFNGKKVHGEFVRNINKIINYYIPKEIVELGIRKRTFSRSQKFKEIKKIENKTTSKSIKNEI
jgi:hypothetical protein